MKRSLLLLAGALLLSSWPGLLVAKAKKDAGMKMASPDQSLADYITRVRTESAAEQRTPGSLWIDSGRMVRLSNDSKALHIHDLVSIVVSESLTASTDGTVKNSRSSSANSKVASLFGNLAANNRLQNLVNQSSSSALTAQGLSSSNSSLTTSFGGEVIDVLPNGMMVVQATRKLTFSQQTQLIRLRGLVRPEDVNAQNQVNSAVMTNLELEVVGKGIVNDYTYRQNPLVRFLQKLLVF